MEQYEANELYKVQNELDELRILMIDMIDEGRDTERKLDRARDTIRAAQRLIDVIQAEKLMTRPNQVHSVSSGGPFDSAHRNLVEALNHYWLPNGSGHVIPRQPDTGPIVVHGQVL